MNQCRVVLIRPKIAANIGATARVMRNFGVSQLTLVSPEAELQDPRGRLLATHAEEILDSAKVVSDLGEAVANCVLVVGTSGRSGGLFRQQSVGPPEQIVTHLVRAMASGPVALVFGPERTGLTDAEVTRCHHLMQIHTDAGHPALNLAQAVAISLYELHKAWQGGHSVAAIEIAPFSMQEQMFSQLQEALVAIHFLYGDKAEPLMHGIRHMLGKARLTKMEVKLLMGLARQMLWVARQPREP
ncbi:MAG TPA: RNA methyltransferase [Gemmataceae bacterium]|nr:RNA methyltransferase [Gemmataceae bacterium]